MSFLISPALASQQGKQEFEANCKACHATDRFSTGPSLVYIRDNYPLSKRSEFLAWSKNPGKVNPDAIQMPPMAHVGEDNLSKIHDYILLVSQHLKEVKDKPKFKPFRAPPKPYPYIKRTYLPFTSPASINVVLSDKLTVVWDTTIGSVRYAYPSHININGEKNRDEVRPKIYYTETASQPLSIAVNKPLDYQGYDLIEGEPEFIYTLGKMEIRERISKGKTNLSFVRDFTIKGLTQPVSIDFSHTVKAGLSTHITATQGQLANNILTLSPSQGAKFSVEVSL